MSRKHGSAILWVMFLALFTIQITNAAIYNVGDGNGWTFGVSNWPNGKNFKAGDVLVFKYPKGVHNVVIVNKANYGSCNASGKILSSGNDRVTLGKGTYYFICGIPGHCNGGQKISVTAK
ncbi:basic blue protein-like [Nicotiana sylvestris]|uniref:Basic blue protein n=1 Tax=Nicotiana sylvestris TaxID=4096 RepID=A0A1U7YG18_NICSY|nr:PREDICTED: basic blue protein-like [Nicotiana sylvestris]